jgi:hypothetical protein
MKANGRTPDPSVSKPTPLTNSIEELTKELLIQFQGDPMLSTGAKDLAKDFTEDIITKVKESLPEKDNRKFPGIEPGQDPIRETCYKQGWNEAIDDIRKALG